MARPFITFSKKKSIQRHNNHTPPQSIVQWPYTCTIISFYQDSKVNIQDLPITFCLPLFMAWLFMMLLITSVQFILEMNLKEGRGWPKFPLAYCVGSITRGTINNHMVRTIRCLKMRFLLTITVFTTRII